MSIALADSRGRITVAERDTIYRVTDLGDGSILLEPAEVLSRAELALRMDPALTAKIGDSITHPERLVSHRRRSPRRGASDA